MKKNNKGSSLYFTMVILAVIAGIILALSIVLVSQTKSVTGISNSVVAFYYADTGIEHAMYKYGLENLKEGKTESDNPSFDYEIHFDGTNIKSIGNYQGVKRAIQVRLPSGPSNPED